MKMKICKKIPTEKAKEYLYIYETLKAYQEKARLALSKIKTDNKKPVSDIKKIFKLIDETFTLKQSEGIKGKITMAFSENLLKNKEVATSKDEMVWVNWGMKRVFGEMYFYAPEAKGKRGPKKDLALDMLIYFLVKEYGKKWDLIVNFLEDYKINAEAYFTDSEAEAYFKKHKESAKIPKGKAGWTIEAVKERFNYINKNDLKEQYDHFFAATILYEETTKKRRDGSAMLRVIYQLPHPSGLFTD